MSKQKTYFEMITGKSGNSAKDNQQKKADGIEGSNLRLAETVVNVNLNESSNGIF